MNKKLSHVYNRRYGFINPSVYIRQIINDISVDGNGLTEYMIYEHLEVINDNNLLKIFTSYTVTDITTYTEEDDVHDFVMFMLCSSYYVFTHKQDLAPLVYPHITMSSIINIAHNMIYTHDISSMRTNNVIEAYMNMLLSEVMSEILRLEIQECITDHIYENVIDTDGYSISDEDIDNSLDDCIHDIAAVTNNIYRLSTAFYRDTVDLKIMRNELINTISLVFVEEIDYVGNNRLVSLHDARISGDNDKDTLYDYLHKVVIGGPYDVS